MSTTTPCALSQPYGLQFCAKCPKLGQFTLHKQNLTDHCGAPSQCSSGSSIEVVRGHSAHEGQLHVSVRVDAARHHVATRRIHHLHVRGNPLQFQADLPAERQRTDSACGANSAHVQCHATHLITPSWQKTSALVWRSAFTTVPPLMSTPLDCRERAQCYSSYTRTRPARAHHF